MKKAISFISIVSFVISAQAQNGNLNGAIGLYEDYTKYSDPKSLLQAKEKIDLAAKDEGTAAKNKTWFYRGQIYLSSFDLNVRTEMNKMQDADINKKLLAAYQIVSMTELDEALKAFRKEIELDEKKVYTNDANSKMKVIASSFSDRAYSSLQNKNFADAVACYEKAYDIELNMGVTDTTAINNMAISAMRMKDYAKAETFYQKLIDIKYKPEKSYLSMIQMYNEANDTASARRITLKGVEAIPDSYALLIEKINLLLRNNQSESAIGSIEQALAKNPSNHELHLVLGQTYNKMAFPKDAKGNDLKRPDNFSELCKKADDEFTKAIQVKADYFAGLYSLGIFYNNMGADILKQSENIKDTKKLKAEEDRADVYFQKAIPLLEKANQLDGTDKDVMRTLRQLYARTGQGDTDKYKRLDAELKGGK